MGDIIDLSENPELLNNRKISMMIVSPIMIHRIELIRNNIILQKFMIKSHEANLKIQDNETFNLIALNNSQKNEKFIFYYLRIFLEDDNMAWSSPIWFVN
ncbi:MAG: hypothetical protein EU539_08870 [Promethearchaeota archaeon]|nr:MAG: hypothetical protein EU539_08870 [Candidatus Lokiarchaeota archaeon]